VIHPDWREIGALSEEMEYGSVGAHEAGRELVNRFGYGEYLKTHYWLTVKTGALERADRCCEFCGNDGRQLHIHHLTYERLGCERDRDLAVLCDSCHQDAREFPEIEQRMRVFFGHARTLPREGDWLDLLVKREMPL